MLERLRIFGQWQRIEQRLVRRGLVLRWKHVEQRRLLEQQRHVEQWVFRWQLVRQWRLGVVVRFVDELLFGILFEQQRR